MQVKLIPSPQGRTVPLPKRGTLLSAGYDLQANIDAPIILGPGEQRIIPTGIALNMSDDLFEELATGWNIGVAAFIQPRSGLGSKGLILGNTVGLIDADYQGELKVCLWNRLPERKPSELDQALAVPLGPYNTHIINPGDRIAQLYFQPVLFPQMDIVDQFSTYTERGAGGYGSTGVAA